MDFFSDGLLRWQDIFRPLVGLSGGLDARTLVRWFDNNSFFRAPEVTGDLTVSGPVPAEIADDGDVPGPEGGHAALAVPVLPGRSLGRRPERADDGADPRGAPARSAESLVGRGYELIHLEEPWLPYFGIDAADWDDSRRRVLELREATAGAPRWSCTPTSATPGRYVDRLRKLPVDALGVDFVQTDVDELGSGWEIGLLAGALDGRSSPIEPAKEHRGVRPAGRRGDRGTVPLRVVELRAGVPARATWPEQKVLRLGEIARLVREGLA